MAVLASVLSARIANTGISPLDAVDVVLEIDGERLWFIDDISHVTCLLPSDY